MNVEQTPLEARHEVSGEDAHESGQRQDVRRMLFDALGQHRFECLSRCVTAMIDALDGNAALRCPRQTVRIRPAGYDRSNANRPFFARRRIDDRPHVAAAAGDEDDQRFHGDIVPAGKVEICWRQARATMGMREKPTFLYIY